MGESSTWCRRVRVRALLSRLAARWDDLVREPWLHTILGIEHSDRQRCNLECRLLAAGLTVMKPLIDFDDPPRRSNARADEANVVFLGPNDAQNLAPPRCPS